MPRRHVAQRAGPRARGRLALHPRDDRGGGDRFSDDGTCITAAPDDTLRLPAAQVATHETCAPRFRLVHGIVGGATTAVHARLGDGLLVRAPARRVPGSAYLAYALVVPATDAVRYVRVTTRAGARDLKLRAAPLPVTCPTEDGGGRCHLQHAVHGLRIRAARDSRPRDR